jgi:hypothetical protein
MEVTDVKVMDHGTGLITQGLATEADSECDRIHRQFLKTHNLTYWQLVILPVFSTTHVMIFSGASGGTKSPNYKLGNTNELAADITEMLETHFKQIGDVDFGGEVHIGT